MKILFIFCFAIGLFSCKTITTIQETAEKQKTESNYGVIVKFQDTGSRAEIMNAIEKIEKPVGIELTEQSIGFIPLVMEIRVSYVALTDKTIHTICKELYNCRGIVEVSISRY